MKKLLFLILVLFGMMSTINFSDAMCGPNGQFDPGSNTCWPVQYENGYTQSAPKYYGAIAVDLETGKWATSYNYPDTSSAKNHVISNCGKNCKVMVVKSGRCGAVAYSKSTKTIEFDSAMGGFAGIGFNTREERAKDKALKKCSKKNSDCIILTSVCGASGI